MVVDSTELVADEVLAIDLVSPTGQSLPAWFPGAHVDVHLPSGLIRSYSLCGDVTNRSGYRVAVLHVHDGRGGSAEVHHLYGGGSRPAEHHRYLRISLPRNNFELVDAEQYLFIAGGIGITPLLPMLEQVSAQGRRWRLVYGGRSMDSMAFRAVIERLQGGQVEFVPQDTRGLIDVAALFDTTPESAQIYVCGPPGLLDATEGAARRTGASARLHLERFAASADSSRPTTPNTEFEVELRRSGTTIHVGAEETILQKVLEIHPGHPWSCEEGICGSCESTVLEGEVDHRDEILTEEEMAADDTMFICVSRCRGNRLVLDL
ncbi:PDR/VanB family oxidoreductase [Nocardia sp. NPDC005745]|uniref:PDR/VanB family oxidoreductase n=1 Tax=Nocardia sp. NPDC005745 TaxID=3157061 RepID=UPI0033EF3A1C